jgi:RNA polymerase sigma-70 factor (sigma-E family)
VGQPDAEFEVFMAARYGPLLRAARLLALDRALAEDLVQTALARTFAHWSSLREPAAAEAYTHTTMVRLAIRDRKRRWIGERPTERLPELPASDEYAARDIALSVGAALATLPIELRAVLVLRYYVQLTEAEVADVLNCPVGTVKSRANRALAVLRESGLLNASAEALEASNE